MTIEGRVYTQTWRDPAAPPAERVCDLLSRMTLREKVAQLYSVWVGVDTARTMLMEQEKLLASLD